MTRGAIFRELRTRCDAAAGAEFALVLPLLILFLFGMIDVGRYMWSVNQLEKATQVGARMAVVTNMVPTGLANTNYGLTLGQGAPIPTSSFGAATCQQPGGSVTCTCTTSPCPTLTPVDSASFGSVATRMKQIAPDIANSNVSILYRNSGLGYAGDPNGPDVAPIVTVTAHDVSFAPLIFFGFSTTLPDESASLTLEDASGTTSN
jgi:hypothetical protein